MARKLYDYDPADALTSEGAVEAFLADAVDAGDVRHIARAMEVVTAAREREAR